MKEIRLVVKFQKNSQEFTKTFRGIALASEYARKNNAKILKIDVIKLA